MATIGEAGVRELDYLVSTHYHIDHIGGMQELARRIPIRTYVDHGPSVETNEQVAGFQAAYAALRGQARHLVVKPGDRLPRHQRNPQRRPPAARAGVGGGGAAGGLEGRGD